MQSLIGGPGQVPSDGDRDQVVGEAVAVGRQQTAATSASRGRISAIGTPATAATTCGDASSSITAGTSQTARSRGDRAARRRRDVAGDRGDRRCVVFLGLDYVRAVDRDLTAQLAE